MTVKITYFIHRTTTDNEQGLASGRSSGILSELGVKQAKELKSSLAETKFDIVFCSDLQRAIDSANIAFGEQYEIIQDQRLRECNYGDYNRKPKEFKSDMKANIDIPFPNGESYKDVEKRMRSFLNFIKGNYEGKHIAIIAHQAPRIALDVIVKNMSWEEAIDAYWRKPKDWQPEEYIIKEIS